MSLKRRPKGYWTKTLVIEEFEIIIQEVNFFPDKTFLQKNGKSYLSNAVRSVGLTFRELRNIFKFPQASKEKGYWSYERIIMELKEIESSIKKFPTFAILISLNRQDLVGAISTHKIPMSILREKLGYDQIYLNKKTTPGKWSKDSVIKEMKTIESKIKCFPNQRILNAMNRSDLSGAINKLKISYYELSGILGYTYIKKPANYWDRSKVINEFTKVNDSINEFPTQKKLMEINRNDLLGAIGQLKISYRELREILGYKNIKPVGYWKNFNNLAIEINKIIKNDNFPTLHKIKMEIGNSAKFAIRRFGGIKEVAKKMGYDYIPPNFWITSDGHYVRSYYEYIFDEYLFSHNIPHEVDGLIIHNRKFRYDFKVGDRFFEIWGLSACPKSKKSKYYESKRIVKERLYNENGLNLVSIEPYVFNLTMPEVEQYFNNLFKDYQLSSKSNVIANLKPYHDKNSENFILEKLKKMFYVMENISLKEIKNKDHNLFNMISRGKGIKYYRSQITKLEKICL